MTVFLWIVGVLLALLCVPAWIRVTWEDEPLVKAGWLFLRVRLYPRPERGKAKPGQEKMARKAPEPPRKEAEKPSFVKMVGLAVDAVQSAAGGLRVILRHLWVSHLRLEVAVGGADAAETAIAYGRMNAYLYSAYGVLQGAVRMRGVEISVRPDFLAEQTRTRLDLKLKLRPLFALGGILRAGAGFLRRMAKRKSAAQADHPAGQAARGNEQNLAGKSGGTESNK